MRHVISMPPGRHEIADAGGLKSYGSNIPEAWRQVGFMPVAKDEFLLAAAAPNLRKLAKLIARAIPEGLAAA